MKRVLAATPGLDWIAGLGRDALGAWAFLVFGLSHLHELKRPPVRTVLHRQLYFTGIRGLGLVLMLGLLVGALVVMQTDALGGDSDLTIRALNWTVVGELGPMLAAITVVARSSVAIATELALMRARGETDQLEAIGVPALNYLVVPRLVALTVSLIVLTVYFEAVAVLGGLAATALVQNMAFGILLDRFLDIASPLHFAVAMLKSAIFGLVIAAVSCWQGLSGLRSVNSVPVAAMNAVVQSLLGVFIVDAFFAYLRFAVF